MKPKVGIKYSMPIHLVVNGNIVRWNKLWEYVTHERGSYLEYDGWRFERNYGLLYMNERAKWAYYIPPSGVKDKKILSVGGGCGETAKFLFENGARSVHVVDNNTECEPYLQHNSKANPNLTYQIKDFDVSDVTADYDLAVFDIEGYETLILPYLDGLNLDMILETHSNYITDRFLEKGFHLASHPDRYVKIYGGVVQVCRLKK